MHYATLLGNFYARLAGVDRSIDCLPRSATQGIPLPGPARKGPFAVAVKYPHTRPIHLTKRRHVTHDHANFACLRVGGADPLGIGSISPYSQDLERAKN